MASLQMEFRLSFLTICFLIPIHAVSIYGQNGNQHALAANVPLRQKALSFGRTVNEIQKQDRLLSELNDVSKFQRGVEGEMDNVLLPNGGEQKNSVERPSEEENLYATQQSDAWRQRKVEAGRFIDDEDTDYLFPLRTLHLRTTEQGDEDKRKFEGDIILFENQVETIEEDAKHLNDRRRKRKFIGPIARRWNTKEPVEYGFDGSHSLREQRIIELALEHWQNITCLNFIRRDNEPTGNRIVFTDVDGCASNVGRHPLGEPQFVSLAPECMRLGVIAHEVAHALGFWHEQSRPDRDNFVNVQWRNIDRDSHGQFLKEQPNDVDNANIPYDYGSIMHYRSKAFAKYDDLFTIRTTVTDYQRTIGQRDQLSFMDIKLMNNIYCKQTCPVPLPCERGGYTDPRRCDRCRCPDGFTGRYCQRVMPGYSSTCGGVVRVRPDSWVTIESPSYPRRFKEGSECSWLLAAPKGLHVELEFVGSFDLYCKARHALCMDYVEVRNSTDFANTGMRYCCYGTPKGSIFSAMEDMLVLFRSFYRSGVGFQARARAVRASGRWSSWGTWSTCSASCGACGVSTRRRECLAGGVCHGSGQESRACNRNPCDVCPNTKYVTAPCGGFLGLLRGVRCKIEKTVYGPCPTKCCTGFTLRGGVCSET